MQTTFKQLKKIARGMHLSAEEKSSMREEIFRYMAAHPVRNPISPRHRLVKKGYYGIPSPFSIISNFKNEISRVSNNVMRFDFTKSTMPILVILGLLMGGSVSFAAEKAIPGDILFPVKVHVNENVRGAVAVTSPAKAEWDVHLVERRLEEVEKLATLPSASSDAKNIAQNNLEKYTERAKDRISKFENENDDEDALAETEQLTKVLSAHEAILNTLDAGQTALGSSVATTTLATTATTTGSILNASSTTGTTNTESISSLDEALKTLREVREYSERKNKEIERKHSSKGEGEHKGNDESPISVDGASTTTSSFGEKGDHKNRMEWTNGEETMNHDSEEDDFNIPSLPPITSTTTNGTLSTTTATTTATTPLHHEVENDNDHINRTFSPASTTASSTLSSTVTSTVSHKIENDSDSSKDSKSSHLETKEGDHN